MKITASVVVLFFFSIHCFAQSSGKIIYVINNIDTKIREDVKQNSEGTKLARNILEIAKLQTFDLKFNSYKSKFYLTSLPMNTEEIEVLLNELASIRFTSNYNYFLDKKAGQELFQYNNGILVEETYKIKNWQVTNETKNIDKYLCYKALYNYEFIATDKTINTRTITAWFAPSLPYSYGPKNYNGLPGLILELQDRETIFLATKIELSGEEIEINFPKGRTISQEEYEKKVSSY